MKKEQDTRQIRSITVLRKQLKLQKNIKCELQSQHVRQNAYRAAETPEQRQSRLHEDQVHHRVAKAAETPIQHVARLLGLRK
ncbi:hypothetical protein TNCT_380761 [Trichonephila clavata]|uniref:Uncharacterized protein n=1 Tax=Trichonephila clavata TaxID=2740835 RepID=A0A8X6FB05_TRICU|nr:hypothetical protein TNCT_380761 [Trichonephila clavata]